MGDLKINFADELSEIAEVLKRAEELLDMINYDSAYHNDKREALLKISTKDELLGDSSLVKDKKKSSVTVRELSNLSDADDDDDEEEIVEEKKKPETVVKVIKNKNTPIAEILSVPQPRAAGSDDDNMPRYDRYVEVNEAEEIRSNNAENVPVYISQDATTLTDISHVRADGERRPLVFVAGTGTTTAVVMENNTNELSLGDVNLLIQENT